MYRIFIKKNISINMCTKFRRTITMIYIVLACRLQTFPHQLHLNVTVRFNKQAFNTRCSDEVIFCIIWERINHSVRNYTGPWRRESKPRLSNCCQCHLLSPTVSQLLSDVTGARLRRIEYFYVHRLLLVVKKKKQITKPLRHKNAADNEMLVVKVES